MDTWILYFFFLAGTWNLKLDFIFLSVVFFFQQQLADDYFYDSVEKISFFFEGNEFF